jgi:hypothetical protein
MQCFAHVNGKMEVPAKFGRGHGFMVTRLKGTLSASTSKEGRMRCESHDENEINKSFRCIDSSPLSTLDKNLGIKLNKV